MNNPEPKPLGRGKAGAAARWRGHESREIRVKVPGLTPPEREFVRVMLDAVVERARSERAAQGLPPAVSDPQTIATVAAVVGTKKPGAVIETPAPGVEVRRDRAASQ